MNHPDDPSQDKQIHPSLARRIEHILKKGGDLKMEAEYSAFRLRTYQHPGVYPYNKTNRMHYFLLIHFINKPLNVSSRLAAHHQEDQLRINSNWYMSCVYVDWLLEGSRRILPRTSLHKA